MHPVWFCGEPVALLRKRRVVIFLSARGEEHASRAFVSVLRAGWTVLVLVSMAKKMAHTAGLVVKCVQQGSIAKLGLVCVPWV